MAAIKTLSNLNKMKRSMRMRDKNLSDAELMELMEEMMNQAIVAQATGNQRMMKRSLSELRQVRKDVYTGNVDVSSNTKQTKMMGRFSNLIDQLEGEEQNTKQEMGGGGGLGQNLPSAETIISAVMTSNPLLGYSAKILKDLGGSVKQKTQADKEASKRQAKILEEQKEYVLGRKEELETEIDINEKAEGQITKYDQILERIESELIRLRQVWEGDDTALVQETEQSNNKLSKLVEVEERLVEEQRLQREQSEFDAIEQGRQNSGGAGGVMDAGSDEEGGGLLGGLLASLGGGVMAGFSGLVGFIKVLGTTGLTLLKTVGKASVVGAVIMAIYDFIDGFFGAGDILDMDEADLNLGDRIIAGFANVWGSIIKLFDTVLEWFGVDLIDSENIEKTIAKKTKALVDNFFTWIFDLFDSVEDFIKNFDISETIQFIKDEAKEFMDKLISIIPDMVTNAFNEAGKLFDNVSDWLWGDEEGSKKGGSDMESQVSEEMKQLRNNQTRGMSFGGSSSSMTMPDAMNSLEQSSGKPESGGAAVVTGNGNTVNNNNTTQVTPIGNTSNLDDTIRNDNLNKLHRLRNS